MSEKNVVQTELSDGDVTLLTSYATTDTPGIASFNPEDFAVTEDGNVTIKQKVGAIQYLGKIKEASSSEVDGVSVQSYIWYVSKKQSAKKLSQVKINDLILLTEDYIVDDEVIVERGSVFAISNTTYPLFETSKEALFSLRGQKGKAATITVASTKTTDPGTDANVTNVGTENAAELAFEIPRGDPAVVTVASDEEIDAIFVGFEPYYETPFLSVEVGTVEKLKADDQPYVTDTGTINNAVLNFGIPSGEDGLSAYQVAVNNGFNGNEEEWLESLIGPVGLSAYQVAVNNGFNGNEEEWLESLIGPVGPQGDKGDPAVVTVASDNEIEDIFGQYTPSDYNPFATEGQIRNLFE